MFVIVYFIGWLRHNNSCYSFGTFANANVYGTITATIVTYCSNVIFTFSVAKLAADIDSL